MKPEDFSLRNRIKKWYKINTLTDEDYRNMRHELLNQGKQTFTKIEQEIKQGKRDEWIYDKILDSYDERILTLPYATLYDLYLSLKEIESSKDKAEASYLFHMHASLSYSLDGWFFKKLFNEGYKDNQF
jgi:hypothetical protein